MAVTLEYARDVSLSIGSDGMTIVREKLISARNIHDIIERGMVPQYGSRHPEDSRFRLTDGNFEQIGNADGTKQWLFTGTYSSRQSSSGDDSGDDKAPWDLAAHDYSEDPFPIKVPVNFLRNKQGKKVPFLNSANCQMQAERDVHGVEYRFIFCIKYKKTAPPRLPADPLVNSQVVEVAGNLFPAYSALLFPPQRRLVVDRDDLGNILRSYWEISCRIQKHPFPGGWFDSYPDVGTMALDTFGNPAPIYRYSPWTSKQADKKLATKPVFGSIQEVVAAKNIYSKLPNPDNTEPTEEEKWQAWQELPYEEYAEPLPLNNGHVYTEAMQDPVANPYKQIYGTLFGVGKFQQYNLPEKREG